MRLLVPVASLCVFLANCSGTKSSENVSNADSVRVDSLKGASIQQVEVTIQPVVEEKITTYNESINYEEQLIVCFTEDQIVKIKGAKAEFEKIDNADDLAHFYMVTLDSILTIINKQISAVYPDLMSGDDLPKEKFEWISTYLPFVGFSVGCSECSYEAAGMLGPLIEIANKTPEKEDNLFFDLAGSVYGGGYDWKGGNGQLDGGWYRLDGCDFCAVSLLGGGQFASVLKYLKAAAPVEPVYGSIMKTYRSYALGVIDEGYWYSKEKVLTEIDAMLSGDLLNVEERTKLKEDRNTIKNGTGGPMQFGCESGHCKWSMDGN